MRRRDSFWLVWLAYVLSTCSSVGMGRETIAVVVEAPLAAPAKQSLGELERVLQAKGYRTEHRRARPKQDLAIVVGVAGSNAVDRLLVEQRIDLPLTTESLCIRRLEDAKRPGLLVAGRDARGLNYALREVARAVELTPDGTDALAEVTEATESPLLNVRTMSVHLFNEDLEKDWYFDERFWRSYFGLLARCRYNNFSLTFSDQTNYLCPVYAYLVDVDGFPQVRVKGLSDAGRQRNLDMLRRITELADEHGLDFTLGVWMQLPVPRYAGQVLVVQLPEGLAAAEFCARGMRQVLTACPAIDGVQLRMNDEAGVRAEQQLEFYRPLFRAIRECGRPVRVDLRYKGLQPETTTAATELGLDVTVSTKFWCEHMGLPYHPTVADRHYRASRYSFGDMLSHDRPYRVVYQLWTVGSQRLLLWGDPAYAARFARSCQLGDGEGFEVFAPLGNKGFGNLPGQWRIFANRADEHFTWEHERYWFFYLAFGRLGYNPDANPEIWRRELRARFGSAAEAVEAGYQHSSQIIPLLTAARLPSASEWSWWPEIDTGDRLPEYMHTPPSDTAQFYAIRTWKRTPRWRCEEWDSDNAGFVEDAVAGQLHPKWTPPQVSRRLRELADQTLQAVDLARSQVRDQSAAEFRATEVDLRVLAQLALYHSEKTLAATDLGFFELTNAAARLPRALQHMRAARDAWTTIIRLTDGVYHANLVFGHTPQSARPQGHHHSGHWNDRLAELHDDVAFLEKLLDEHSNPGQQNQTFPGEALDPHPPHIEHRVPQSVPAGADLPLAFQVTSVTPVSQVILHYRPLNQTLDWKQLELLASEDGNYAVTLSSKDILDRWDFQYFVEVRTTTGGGRLWPAWEDCPPYCVVRTGT